MLYTFYYELRTTSQHFLQVNIFYLVAQLSYNFYIITQFLYNFYTIFYILLTYFLCTFSADLEKLLTRLFCKHRQTFYITFTQFSYNRTIFYILLTYFLCTFFVFPLLTSQKDCSHFFRTSFTYFSCNFHVLLHTSYLLLTYFSCKPRKKFGQYFLHVLLNFSYNFHTIFIQFSYNFHTIFVHFLCNCELHKNSRNNSHNIFTQLLYNWLHNFYNSAIFFCTLFTQLLHNFLQLLCIFLV